MKFFRSANHRQARQAGYTLVELSIVLAVVSAIMVGGLVAARKVYMSTSVNNQAKDSVTLISKLQRQFAGRTVGKSLNTSNAIGLNLWPSTRLNTVASEDPNDSTKTVTTTEVLGVLSGTKEYVNTDSAGTLILYTIQNVPSGACSELVSSLDSLVQNIWVSAGTTAAVTSPSMVDAKKVKANGGTLNVTTLGGLCAANSNSDITMQILAD